MFLRTTKKWSKTSNIGFVKVLACFCKNSSDLIIVLEMYAVLKEGIFFDTVGGIAYICFKGFQITADAHPGVSGVSKDQKFCEKFKNTHCQVDHPAKIE